MVELSPLLSDMNRGGTAQREPLLPPAEMPPGSRIRLTSTVGTALEAAVRGAVLHPFVSVTNRSGRGCAAARNDVRDGPRPGHTHDPIGVGA